MVRGKSHLWDWLFVILKRIYFFCQRSSALRQTFFEWFDEDRKKNKAPPREDTLEGWVKQSPQSLVFYAINVIYNLCKTTGKTRQTSIKCNDNRAKINVGFPKTILYRNVMLLFNHLNVGIKWIKYLAKSNNNWRKHGYFRYLCVIKAYECVKQVNYSISVN